METGRKEAAKEVQWPDESRMSDLPKHVLMEILCRLPIETLMAVKRVSKSCLNLVSGDTDLAELHRQRSPTKLLLRYAKSDELYLGKFQFQNNVSGFKPSLLFDLPKFRSNNTIDCNPKNRERADFVNSCNGLLCFRNLNFDDDSHCALICNPFTGESITVPEAKLDCYLLYSLGFSRKESRYKLLRIKGRRVLSCWSTELFGGICTFEKGSSWRKLGDCPLRIGKVLCDTPYLFFEGKLHFRCPCDKEKYIDYFDFDSEQFGKLPLPPHRDCDLTSISINRRNVMAVLWGCLSVFQFGSGYCIEIWVMKEYGVKDSWTKAYSIVNDHALNGWAGLGVPLMYMGNDEILMYRVDNNLIVCNPVLNTTSVLGSGYNCVQMIAYTPTLLRLKVALAGYEVCVLKADSRSADPGVPHWWRPSRS